MPMTTSGFRCLLATLGGLLFAAALQAGDAPPAPPPDPSVLEEGHPRPEPSEKEEDPDPDWVSKDPFFTPGLTIGERKEKPEPGASPAGEACKLCAGHGRLKSDRADPAYLLYENDATPDPSVSLGWLPCPDCTRGAECKKAFEAERVRLAGRIKLYREHEQQTGMSFIDFETRHVSGHFQTTRAEAEEVARCFAALDGKLHEKLGSATFSGARAATHHIVVCENQESYKKYVVMMAQAKSLGEAEQWLELTLNASATSSRKGAIINRERVVHGTGSNLAHMAVFSYASLLIAEASENKAPYWLKEGFSSHSEQSVFGDCRCYSIRYEANDGVRFEADWAAAIARAQRQGILLDWSILFTRQLVSMKVHEYQQCWSVVKYLYSLDGKAFAKLPVLFAAGKDSQAAIEEAYGHPLEKLERSWKVWAGQGGK